MTDARQLARHLTWAATAPAARNEAFNIVNGDSFRWNWLWPRLGAWFGLEAAAYPGQPSPLEQQMADAGPIWSRIAAEHGLAEADLGRLASPWHTDADLGRPVECVTDMSKSRLRGFHGYQYTPDSFFDLFARLRRQKLIP
jgi:nucleoside-diphosphate-sugar epimerase